jgi:hypothetical protein
MSNGAFMISQTANTSGNKKPTTGFEAEMGSGQG